ncbi:hypothetical protein H9Y04_13580 [Streptomyces sp. TRM66268-LWL]|uniref:Uncharacterized protein n=1 Tax=Streptomyces polyasparticus TaxID=2767826 RepID=A0ABR7SEJ4_9ACTN|nr:hypothetical protein [Streptomyces polyasparticus]MBC9713599.1 hypothetical protein [Streptomyces polyasparticus]
MAYTTARDRAVSYLLSLADPADAGRIERRIGVAPQDASDRGREEEAVRRSWLMAHRLPVSVLHWVMQQDDPELNVLVCLHPSADNAIRRQILRGVPCAPDAKRAVLPVSPRLNRGVEEAPLPGRFHELGLIGTLRAARTRAQGRTAASMVLDRHDWAAVTDADREEALPGFARWALAVRHDCPPALRRQFGTHAKFHHRVRAAGAFDSPVEFALDHVPALNVLAVLSLGHRLFPQRLADASDALRPLVREYLADDTEAWAVLAQLVQEFRGGVEELVITAGAVAGG